MFCPRCNAEYREGFTVCSDSGTAVVSELPVVGSGPAYFLPSTGEGPVLHDSLIAELRTEHIHYLTARQLQ